VGRRREGEKKARGNSWKRTDNKRSKKIKEKKEKKRSSRAQRWLEGGKKPEKFDGKKRGDNHCARQENPNDFRSQQIFPIPHNAGIIKKGQKSGQGPTVKRPPGGGKGKKPGGGEGGGRGRKAAAGGKPKQMNSD